MLAFPSFVRTSEALPHLATAACSQDSLVSSGLPSFPPLPHISLSESRSNSCPCLITVSLYVFIFYCCCNKLLLNGSKQQTYILRVRNPNGVCLAKISVSKLCSFWRLQWRICFLASSGFQGPPAFPGPCICVTLAFASTVTSFLTLLPSSFSYMDPCDDVRFTQIIQYNLLTAKFILP